jgi:hypothetical protein
MTYSVGDRCTYSCEVVRPFTYDSAEAALVDLERQATELRDRVLALQQAGCRTWWRAENTTFTFAGIELGYDDLVVDGRLYLPTIQTLDEWFEAGGNT